VVAVVAVIARYVAGPPPTRARAVPRARVGAGLWRLV
jgi:hypothetical protein